MLLDRVEENPPVDFPELASQYLVWNNPLDLEISDG
jgi:hypothetical protein